MPETHRDSDFLLAERGAIWSFGITGGYPVLGFSLLLRYRPHFLTALAGLALLIATLAAPAFAARARHHAASPAAAKFLGHRGRRATVRMLASPTDPDKDAALVVDGATGKALYARNEAVERHPA